ncbi:MAG: FAD-dependent oxidoreductase [Euryarchaeota archaeon]|nr:FAD-dependent oxidoreductase [Euryarchaeota archaeon]
MFGDFMHVDVLVVGGGPAGIIAATTAKASYPDKDVLVIRKEEKVLVPCGIPYIFGTLRDVDKDVIPDSALTSKDVELMLDTVEDIRLQDKVAVTREHGEISFEKLILATGSLPRMLPIEGSEKENVYFVKKDPNYLKDMMAAVDSSDRIGIIGGGFIGVEFADELRKLNKEVHIIEIMPHLLYTSFDDEFCVLAENELKKNGVNVHTNTKVKRILGDKKVSGVEFEGGGRLELDMVIISAGAQPNIYLADRMGLRTSKYGIEVDEYMRTSHPDVFAVGDCAQKVDFFTRKPKPTMLASVATAEARVAGANVYRIRAFKQVRGTLGIFSTKIGDLALGAAGMIERYAQREGFEYVVGRSEVVDKHPGSLPNAKKLHTKVIITKQGGFFLGGQIAGGDTVGELANILGFAIESEYTADKYMNLQVGTHPLLTPPPTTQATITAVQNALTKLRE